MANKECSKCGKLFGCNSDGRGCWCENYTVDADTLQKLEQDFDNCLCEDCLKGYANSVEINNVAT